MVAVAHLAESNVEGQEANWGRDEVIARYRQLRAISRRHNSAAMKLLARDAILQQARRLGLAQGKTFILDTMDEIDLALDLAIYTAPPGRSRALDRYARISRFAPGSDEALVLDAMRQARFAIVSVTRQHAAAGMIVTDLVRQRDLWLMDEGLESSLSAGTVFATRYYEPDRFFMTAGVVVPVDIDLLAGAADAAGHLARRPLTEAVDDRRFAEAIYRAAIADGLMEGVAFQDVPSSGASG